MQLLAAGPDQISDPRLPASLRPRAREVPGDSWIDVFQASHSPSFLLRRSPW